ncbi:unnamed protein product [Paramecium sonneborni]|uniref:RING-type domain-containing protein n=1 Tax=Paramecium sonneborni TaxID=65129 RepID=A0A8S1QGV1_9CILI|nr:unnamed protein product [Paramecium sonneborni]
MNQIGTRKQCDICQYTKENTYQNPFCKHNYCLNCVQKHSIIKLCQVKGCNAQIQVNDMSLFFEGDSRPKKEEQTQLFNNNSNLSIQQNSRLQINNKSKQYASPNESNIDFKQQQIKNIKIELSDTQNYCAICLFYLKDELLKQQIQVNNIHPILDCQFHTICVVCFSKYFAYQKSKQYFCEICQRLNK